MTGERPSAVVARYVAGELTRDEAAERLAVAAWDDTYTRASMEPGGDYDGDFPEPESFAMVVYQANWAGHLDDDDYAAFQHAYVRWQATGTSGG